MSDRIVIVVVIGIAAIGLLASALTVAAVWMDAKDREKRERRPAAVNTSSADDAYDASLPDCKDGVHVGACRHAPGRRKGK